MDRTSLTIGDTMGKIYRARDSRLERSVALKILPSHIATYVRLAAPEPEILRVLGEESQRNGTDALSSHRIDQIIKATRARQPKRK